MLEAEKMGDLINFFSELVCLVAYIRFPLFFVILNCSCVLRNHIIMVVVIIIIIIIIIIRLSSVMQFH